MYLPFHFNYIAILCVLKAGREGSAGAVYVSGVKPKSLSIRSATTI